MAPIQAQTKKPIGNVLVIGGCGFLGHHIVNLLLASYSAKISVLDLHTTRNRRPESDGVSYYNGDITKLPDLLKVFGEVQPDVVIHTASPVAFGNPDVYYKVNVQGTKAVIEACQKTGVKALVYTSSASIISDNSSDLINADERWPIIPAKQQTEYYSTTKAEAEVAVLEANRAAPSPNLLTASIRPAGIFGAGDVQLLPPIINVFTTNKTGFQLGDNTNLFDFTYVENVAHAHILAARALLATSKLTTIPLEHEKVDGEAFFITNDSPVPFWDFTRAVWKYAGSELGTDHVWVIGRDTGLLLGGVMEWVMSLVGKQAKLTRRQVKYSCMTRYYDIGKAKRRLGYAPIVELEEGIKRGVGWFLEEKKKAGETKGQ